MLYLALAVLVALVGAAYWLETRRTLAARAGSIAVAEPPPRRERIRHAIVWSALWLALGLLPTLLFGLLRSSGSASSYAAVYLIERSLSLDNVFVFAVLIAAFEIPASERETLVSWGAFAAFALRAPAIVGGVALFETSHLVGYALGALLLALAWQTARGGGEGESGRIVALLRRRLPVGEHAGRRLLVVRDGRRRVTPMLLCLIAIMLADVTFAVDSIPAALAISHDTTLLLTSNLLALLGLRALFELVSVARESLRYMDETIAVLLALVGVKLLAARVLHVSALASLLAVIVVLGVGVALSLRAQARAVRSSPGA